MCKWDGGTRWRRRWPRGQTNREQVLRVCPGSRSLPSSLLVPGDPGRGEEMRMLRAGTPPWDTRRMGMADGDLRRVLLVLVALAPPAESRVGKGITTGPSCHPSHGMCPHSCSAPTFSPFTFAVTTVPSGLMMTPGSPFSPCKKGARGDAGMRVSPPIASSPAPRQDGGPHRGDLEQLPSTLECPGDQMHPCLLSVPLVPAVRSTEPVSVPTHQTPSKASPKLAFNPVVPNPARDSPGSQHDLVCPAERSRDA